jgi:hypothetical protein
MNSIKAIAIYKTKNNLTTHTYDGTYWVVSYPCGFMFLTEEEKYIIGTRGGSIPYSKLRVDEYTKYKTGEKTLEEFIIEKYGISKSFIDSINNEYKYYYNLLFKEWFGDDYVSMF